MSSERLSAKDLERYGVLNTLHNVVTARLGEAYRFAREWTTIITDHPRFKQDYTDIRERWEKLDGTCKQPGFSPSTVHMRQLFLLYDMQVEFLDCFLPHLRSADIHNDEHLTEQMLHLPYKGDIFNFNKEDIDMLHK